MPQIKGEWTHALEITAVELVRLEPERAAFDEDGGTDGDECDGQDDVAPA